MSYEEEDTCMALLIAHQHAHGHHKVYLSFEEEDTCAYEEEDTCMAYEEKDTCMTYEEEDTCMAYEEEDHMPCKKIANVYLLPLQQFASRKLPRTLPPSSAFCARCIQNGLVLYI